MNPTLVEPSIKYILNSELKSSRYNKFIENSFMFNLILFVLFIVFFLFLGWLLYKGKQDPKIIKERERKKKEYIMSKLHTYQKMKQEVYTNIPC